METAMALPHLLIPECKEETYAVPEQAGVLAEQVFQCLISKERHFDEHFSTIFIPFRYVYDNAYPHGGWGVVYARRWPARTF